MLNKMLLIGTLLDSPLQDPSRLLPTVVRFSLRVEPTTLFAWPKQQHAELFHVQASGDLGQWCLRELDRGSLVFVEGKLVQDGGEPEPVWVEAREVELLTGTRGEQAFTEPAVDAQVAVFARETTAVMIEALEKLPFAAFLPYRHVPTSVRWIELESVPAASSRHLPFQAVRLSQHGQQVSCRLFQETGEIMSLVLAPDEHWTVEFPERCSALSCPRPSNSKPQRSMRVTREQAVVSHSFCSCAAAAAQAVRLFSLLGHVYAAEGIVPTLLSQLPPLAQRWKGLIFGEATAEAGPMRCVRLALLAHAGHAEQEGGPARTPERRELSPSASPNTPTKSFAPYHRILVPGEKRPWRRFQVIYVTPRQTGENILEAHD